MYAILNTKTNKWSSPKGIWSKVPYFWDKIGHAKSHIRMAFAYPEMKEYYLSDVCYLIKYHEPQGEKSEYAFKEEKRIPFIDIMNDMKIDRKFGGIDNGHHKKNK